MLTVQSLKSGCASCTRCWYKLGMVQQRTLRSSTLGAGFCAPAETQKALGIFLPLLTPCQECNRVPLGWQKAVRKFRCWCKYQCRLKSGMWPWFPQVISQSVLKGGCWVLADSPRTEPQHCRRLPRISSPPLWPWTGPSPLQDWIKRELRSHSWPT